MLAFCPEIYEGETLYSWLARWGLRSGMPSSRVALKYLIGFRHEQLMSLLPSYVEPLAEASHLSVYELIHNHTAIDYFQPFSEPDVFKHVVKDMARGNTHSAYTQLSIIASRVIEPAELRYCPICTAKDYIKYGVTIWHIEHQLPGVMACALHHTLLQGLAKKRSRLLLPPVFDLTSYPSTAPSAAIRIAQLSSELLLSGLQAPNNDRLVFGYRVRLAEKGHASIGLQVKQEAWRKELEEIWAPVLEEPSIKSIFELGNRSQFPTCMVRGYATQRHPLKHLLMIGALFKSVSEFIGYCKGAEVMHESLIKHNRQISSKFKQPTNLIYQQRAIILLRQGKSLRQVSQALGGSVTTLKLIALRHNINIIRRPQKLFATERRAIWRQLIIGMSTKDIAVNINCSVGAVEQELCCYPELKDLRRKVRYHRKRSEHRARLIHTMMRLVSPTRSQIQEAARASYTWLFKHDKHWLYQQLPQAINR